MVSKNKYTVNVAYTTPSGRMHIGHGLGHTISDIVLRYGALRQEKDTFFGFGIHATGKDLIKIILKLNEEEQLSETLEQYNISKQKRDEIISKHSLQEQINELVEEYRKQYQQVIEGLGVIMDYDSFFSTHQEANQRYTKWTLRKLDEKGLIIKTISDRPYCPKCEDIKHIDKDLSEVSAIGKVNWDILRIEDGKIIGGNFECRVHSGEKIIIKRREERAINYANPEMQQKTIELASRMEIFPRKYKSDLEGIVRTRLAKPFERKAQKNIGAISPFDSTKKIEALSDSNIYMEFYALSQLLNKGKLKLENLTDKFFDYVYLGRGNVDDVAKETGTSTEIIEKAKEQINNTYPVNISIAGYEHLTVHVPFSLFTHAAVLPAKYFFPEYIITSHITKNGEKMSKSKGNVVYLDELLDLTKRIGKINEMSEEASLDAIRFFLSYYQSLDKDFDWNDENFKSSGIKSMKKYVLSIMSASKSLNNLEERILGLKDKWFLTLDQKTIQEITEKMDEKDLRGALISLVDIRGKALSSYLSSPNPNKKALSLFLINQINMGYPIMPRVANELRRRYFHEAILEWPSVNTEIIFSEEYERVEHEMKGTSYEKNLLGEVNVLLNKMFGRQEIVVGETLNLVSPTEYQTKVLCKQNIPLSDKFNLKFITDSNVNKIEIRKDE